jgi:transcriptional regulator GlxA family with amidase domain
MELMQISIIAFDNFTDIDIFFLWDVLNRVKSPDWQVKILGDKDHHISSTGLTIPMHGHLSESSASTAVLFASGKGTRDKINDQQYLKSFNLDGSRQLIGSMCSGALILAAMGLLSGKSATTYPSAKILLEGYGVNVVEQPFVCEGNIATAAGCLAAQYLTGWVIERLIGKQMRETVLKSISPVGEGLSFADYDIDSKFIIDSASLAQHV